MKGVNTYGRGDNERGVRRLMVSGLLGTRSSKATGGSWGPSGAGAGVGVVVEGFLNCSMR